MIIGGTWEVISIPCPYSGFSHTHQEEVPNLEVLDGSQVRLELKLGQDNNLISSIRPRMTNNHQRIDMALREKAQCGFGEVSTRGRLRISPCLLKG